MAVHGDIAESGIGKVLRQGCGRIHGHIADPPGPFHPPGILRISRLADNQKTAPPDATPLPPPRKRAEGFSRNIPFQKQLLHRKPPRHREGCRPTPVRRSSGRPVPGGCGVAQTPRSRATGRPRRRRHRDTARGCVAARHRPRTRCRASATTPARAGTTGPSGGAGRARSSFRAA